MNLSILTGVTEGILSRSEMKRITAGGGCVLYCCTGGPGTCSSGQSCTECSGSTNEDCQSSAISLGWSCSEGYLAALFVSESPV